MDQKSLYTKISNFYDIGLWLNGYGRAVNYIIKQLPFEQNQFINVLDAGCGTGLYSVAILKHYPNARVIAFDLNEKMLEKIKLNLEKENLMNRIEIFTADITMYASQEKLDLIITGGVLEYVDIAGAVNNLSRYLKNGGYFINSPVKDNFLGRMSGKLAGLKPYSEKENTEAFTKNGFTLFKIIKFPHRYFPISLIKEAHIFKKRL